MLCQALLSNAGPLHRFHGPWPHLGSLNILILGDHIVSPLNISWSPSADWALNFALASVEIISAIASSPFVSNIAAMAIA